MIDPTRSPWKEIQLWLAFVGGMLVVLTSLTTLIKTCADVVQRIATWRRGRQQGKLVARVEDQAFALLAEIREESKRKLIRPIDVTDRLAAAQRVQAQGVIRITQESGRFYAEIRGGLAFTHGKPPQERE